MSNYISIPTSFDVDLPDENKFYYNSNNKNEILVPLLKASKGYCMYCGKSLHNETDIIAHLEHSVDKEGNDGQGNGDYKYLKHCKYNFSISCPVCNMVCKKKIEKLDLVDAPKSIECKKKNCKERRCDMYSQLRSDYMKKNAIILQPEGYKNDDIEYGISYDLLKHIYSPDIIGSEETKEDPFNHFFVQNHIDRFKLNGSRFSECVLNICADIVHIYKSGVESKEAIFSFFEGKKFTNIIGELFLAYLKQSFKESSITQIVEYCNLLVLIDAVN